MRYKLITLPIVTLLTIACCVGCSNTLNRDTAGEKIKTYDNFAEPIKLYTYVGRIGTSCQSEPPSRDMELTVASLAGYVTVKPDGKDFWQVSLTDKGRALPDAKKLESDTPETKGGCSFKLLSIPFATREFVEVTGITSSDNQAQVEFLYKWRPTELGSALTENGSIYTKLTSEQQELLRAVIQGRSSVLWTGAPLNLPLTDVDLSVGDTGKARFQKYDDGWRLMTP